MSEIYKEDIVLEPQPVDSVTCEEPVVKAGDLCSSEPCAESPTYTIGDFFGTLQEAVTNIWKYHLTTDKHFIHEELRTTYYALLEITDHIIEAYQGLVCVIPADQYVNKVSSAGLSCVEYLRNMRSFIRTSRTVFLQEWTEIHSLIDDILKELDTTLYKIVNFQEMPIQTFEEFCYSQKFKHLNEKHCKDCDEDETEFDDEEEEE